MVEFITAVAFVWCENATLVELEAELFSVNRDRGWLLLESCKELVLTVGGDISVRGHGNDLVVSLSVAATECVTLVGVLFLRFEWVGLSIAERVVHQSSHAAQVSEAVRAVDELLLRVGVEGLALEEGSTFD